MENKINIAELLKDCPKGMELDCALFDNVILSRIDLDPDCDYPIRIETKGGCLMDLTKYGTYTNEEETKCVIFPKGKTTWEGFVPPCQFKDGDVISVIINKNRWYGIYQKEFNTILYSYVDYSDSTKKLYPSNGNGLCQIDDIVEMRLATEKEKQKLFDAIKDNGYRWNPETKTLEKLPKFKVGDRIKYIYLDRKVAKVVKIHDKRYELDNGKFLEFQDENAYEISYDKFDINTLKPFDKVLVRDFDNGIWDIDFFSRLLDGKHFKCLDVSYTQCIPYEGNEHLLGTTDDCDDFYKTWEK